MRRRLLIACHAVLALSLLTGCNSEDAAVQGTPVAPPGEPQAAQPTEAVTADLKKVGSASKAAESYYRFIQGGALPAALSLYDPRVIRNIDLAVLSGALAAQKAQLEDARLNVLDVESTADGRLVTLEILRDVGAKSRHTFFFRRIRGQWKLVYDTLSAEAIQVFARSRAQLRAGETDPSPESVAAGEEAVSEYRRVALR